MPLRTILRRESGGGESGAPSAGRQISSIGRAVFLICAVGGVVPGIVYN